MPADLTLPPLWRGTGWVRLPLTPAPFGANIHSRLADSKLQRKDHESLRNRQYANRGRQGRDLACIDSIQNARLSAEQRLLAALNQSSGTIVGR